MNMEIEKLNEFGFNEAVQGLSLSYGVSWEKAYNATYKLVDKNKGHNKFLESMQLWIKIKAPRYWWQEFDTYRVGVTKQSDSTMHTIMKKDLTQDDFNEPIYNDTLTKLNLDINLYKTTEDTEIKELIFRKIKNNLPEGFLQTRIVNLNYKALRNILEQRKNHKLKEWKYFCETIYKQADISMYLKDIMEK